MCNGAEENQAYCCNPYGLRVQEQPLFLVYSSINIITSMGVKIVMLEQTKKRLLLNP